MTKRDRFKNDVIETYLKKFIKPIMHCTTNKQLMDILKQIHQAGVNDGIGIVQDSPGDYLAKPDM